MGKKATTSKAQSQAVNRIINDLDLRGYTHQEIANELATKHSITMTRVAVLMRIKNMNANTRQEREERIAQEERLITWAVREAMDSWQASKNTNETTFTEKNATGGVRASVKKQTQTGEASHLKNVITASESRRKLLGLDAPTMTRQESLPPVDWTQVPDDMQLSFLDGSMTLREIAAYVASKKQVG